ncbi:TlpA family protein disulfide reductase [Blautia sp. HCP28S3_G10]|uniref:TlpA family protein disulfide reductase n=1 Tax=Blautia sp. HCP28S3_G10 TaxID=3438908 RepID=UPI003F8BF397
MKFRTQKIAALMTVAVLGISTLGSMPVMAEENTETADDGEAMADDGEAMAVDGDAMAVDGEAISSDLISGTFKPSEVTCQAQDSYEYPFLGLKFSLPKELLKQIEDQSIAMITTEDETNQTGAVTYAYVSWGEMTEEQKNAEVDKMGTGYEEWVASLSRIGTLGIYDEDSQKKLDEITGCTEHKELGSSSDGKYKYYLSTNKEADEKLTKELEEIKTTITEMTPYQNTSVFDQPQDASVNSDDVTSVGKFETTGIDGKTYTEEVFSDYDLTLVNIFTTWCSPCVQEIPELQKLYEEMKEKGVGVAGVVLDAADENGNPDEDTVKKAGILQEKTKAEYPFLIPDSTMLNGRLKGINAFPETFFVDKNGNIVGDTYTGSHSLDEWKEIVEKELKNVSK